MNYVRRLSNNFLELIGAKKTPERLQNDGNTKRVNSGAETERPHDELFVTSTPRTPMKKRPKIDGSIQNETNMDWSIHPQPSMSSTTLEKKLKSKDKDLANSFEQDQRNCDDSDPKWQNDKEISLKEDLEAKEMMDDIIDSFETPKQATSYKNSNSAPNHSLIEEDQNQSTSEKRMQESSFSEPSEESTLDFSIDESFSDDMQDLSRHSSDSSIEENMWSLYSSSSDSASEGYFCKLCNYRTESLFVFERHQKHLEHMNREKRLKTLQSSYGKNGENPKLKQYVCHECNLTSFHRDIIRIHKKQEHGKEEPTSSNTNTYMDFENSCCYCDFCPFKTTSVRTLLRHNEDIHTS